MATDNSERPVESTNGTPGTLTLPQTARRLGVARTTLYDLVAAGEPPFRPENGRPWIPIHMIGTQRRTLRTEVERYLAGEPGPIYTAQAS